MREVFDSKEFYILQKKYGEDAEIKSVDYEFTNKEFFNEIKAKIDDNRRAEVGFFTQRPNGKFIIVRTSFYPKNIYRVPTGGVNFGEKVIDALLREVKEELGLDVEIERFLGVIMHSIEYIDEHLDFYSYMFHLKEISGNVLNDATDKEISEFKEVDKEGLISAAGLLRDYKGKWHDWCSFRAETTSFIIDQI